MVMAWHSLLVGKEVHPIDVDNEEKTWNLGRKLRSQHEPAKKSHLYFHLPLVSSLSYLPVISVGGNHNRNHFTYILDLIHIWFIFCIYISPSLSFHEVYIVIGKSYNTQISKWITKYREVIKLWRNVGRVKIWRIMMAERGNFREEEPVVRSSSWSQMEPFDYLYM